MSAAAVALAMLMMSPASAQYYGGYGHGMMGQRMMGPGAMGPGMMGQGYGVMGHGMRGPGMMGPGMMGQGMTGSGMMGPGLGGVVQPVLNLTTNGVKVNFERWIAASGNPNIMVGSVVEKDTNTITADIVTKENSFVQQFTVDRHTGYYGPAQ